MPTSLLHVDEHTRLGANLEADGATFRVWAPSAEAVHVCGTPIGWTPSDGNRLNRQDGGFWAGFVPGFVDGHRYKFWVVGRGSTGWKRDPYARELDTPFPGMCVVRSPSFPWHETGFKTPRFEDFVIYQLHVGAFWAPNWPQKAGTFLDVADRVPYLADLGVTALQLLPVVEFSSQFSKGYNGVDYFSPEMDFGLEDDRIPTYLARINAMLAARGLAEYRLDDLTTEVNQLKALVDLCHVHGIAILFDLVFNHAGGGFGDESIYFFDRDEGQDQSPPRFENSLYFTERGHAGGLVFDYGKDQVRQFLIDNALFCLDEYRVDGFRYDQVSVIDHDGAPHGWRFCQDLTATLEFVRPDAFQLAEYWQVNPYVVKPISQGGAGFDATLTDGLRIGIRHVLRQAAIGGEAPLDMTMLANSLWPYGFSGTWQFVQGPENHDRVYKDTPHERREPRIARLAGGNDARSWYARSRSRAVLGLSLAAPGVPMLFMGQEFLEDKQWSDNLEQDAHLLLYWAGLTADRHMSDFLRFTREMIELRMRLPALRSEGFRVTHVHDADRVLAFHRWIPGIGHDVIVVQSLMETTRHNYRIGFPSGGRWIEAFNSDVYDHWVNPAVAGNGGEIHASSPGLHGFDHSASLVLPANSILVFARDSTAAS